MASQSLTSKPKKVKVVQGASKFTEKKEYDFKHLIKIRTTQFKTEEPNFSHIKKLFFGDVFCGSGYNIVDTKEGQTLVHGSPFGILEAIEQAITMKDGTKQPKGLASRNLHVHLNDIRKGISDDAVDELRRKYEIENGIWKPCDGLDVKVTTSQMPAADFISKVHDTLKRQKGAHVILLIDPNRPTEFPRTEIIKLVKAFPNSVDFIIYLSAHTINRCILSRNATGNIFKWLENVEGLDSGFILATKIHQRQMWIREPMKGDAQYWMVIPSFTQYPRLYNDWEANGFVEVGSQRGKRAIQSYSGIKEAA